MSPKGYFLIFIAFHLAVVSHLAAVPLNGPSNPVIPPASYSVCNTRNTTNGGCCVFPFTYRGIDYYDCTKKDYSRAEWCATTSDYDAKASEWGECVTEPEIFDIILDANNKQASFRQSNSSGVELFQGDIVVDSQIRTYLNSIGVNNNTPAGSRRTKRAAMRNMGARWMTNGRPLIPYVIQRSNAHARGVIQQAMRHWTSKVPCLRFIENSNRRYRAYLSFFSGGGCYSNVGRIRNGAQPISIGRGCERMGIVAHEIGHALGFWHEQSRPDRDRYVRINWGNIPSRVRHNFNKYGTNIVNSRGVSYDYGSLMHYSANAFSSNGRPTISAKNGRRKLGQRYGLSPKDVQQANLMYCGSGPRPQTPRPPRPPTPPPPGCRHTDNSRWCSFWKSEGYCTSSKYRAFMLKTCKKSCLCSQTASCKDKESRQCSSWKKYCKGGQYAPYVRSACRKTCKLCT